MKPPYIPFKYLPPKPPMLASAAWITILHYWGAPDWAFGVVAALLLIVWIAYFIEIFTRDQMKKPPFDD